MGPGGGTIVSTAPDGTRYTLTVPPGALVQDTNLTMTPVAVQGTLGLPVQLNYAVQIGPEGTLFLGGAELAVQLPVGVDPTAFQPYIMQDSGSPMSLTSSQVSGQTIRFKLFHLTTPGLSNSPVPSPPSTSGANDLEAIAAAVAQERNALLVGGGDASLPRVQALLEDYFRNKLKPALVAAAQGTEAQCQQAVRDALQFLRITQEVGSQLGPAYQQELDPLIAAALRRGIALAETKAVNEDSLSALSSINTFYYPCAQLLGLDTPANHLDGQTLTRELPLKVVIESVQAASILAEGETDTVLVRAGFQIANKPVKHDSTLPVTLNLVGGTPATSTQNTVGGTATFTPIRLASNSRQISGSVGVDTFFGGLGPLTSSMNFTTQGKLTLTLTHSAPIGNLSTFTANVRKGSAALQGALLHFTALSGGSVNQSQSNSDTSGQGSVQFTSSGGVGTVQVSVSDGSQTAQVTDQIGSTTTQTDFTVDAVGTVESDSSTRGIVLQPGDPVSLRLVVLGGVVSDCQIILSPFQHEGISQGTPVVNGVITQVFPNGSSITLTLPTTPGGQIRGVYFSPAHFIELTLVPESSIVFNIPTQ